MFLIITILSYSSNSFIVYIPRMFYNFQMPLLPLRDLSLCILIFACKTICLFNWLYAIEGSCPIVLWSVALWSIHINIILGLCLRHLPNVVVKQLYFFSSSKCKYHWVFRGQKYKFKNISMTCKHKILFLCIFSKTSKDMDFTFNVCTWNYYVSICLHVHMCFLWGMNAILFFHTLSYFFQTPFLEQFISPQWSAMILHHMLHFYICMDLFLDSLFCSVWSICLDCQSFIISQFLVE